MLNPVCWNSEVNAHWS